MILKKERKASPLSDIIPLFSSGYLVIHSILVSVLRGIVLYSSPKKGIKYMLLIVPSSLIVYYFSEII